MTIRSFVKPFEVFTNQPLKRLAGIYFKNLGNLLIFTIIGNLLIILILQTVRRARKNIKILRGKN